MKIIQVVGYKNSGKTTATRTILKAFRAQEIKVASLKHHGHGGFPDGLDEKDSLLHHRAGAMIAGVEGAGMLQLLKDEPWELEEILALYKQFNVEIVIVEGFKQAKYEKIVLIKDETDLHLLEQLSNIIAVVTTLSLENVEANYQVFQPNRLEELGEWLVNRGNKK